MNCICAEAGVFAKLCSAGVREPFYCVRGFVVPEPENCAPIGVCPAGGEHKWVWQPPEIDVTRVGFWSCDECSEQRWERG